MKKDSSIFDSVDLFIRLVHIDLIDNALYDLGNSLVFLKIEKVMDIHYCFF